MTNIAIVGSNFTQTNNCPVGGNLRAGRSCSITVRFTPTVLGIRTATLVVTDADPTSPQNVSLTGTGVQPVASLTPASQNFGTIARRTTSPAFGFTLSNAGPGPLTINNISIGGANPGQFNISNSNCGTNLAQGFSCTINVTFRSNGAGTFNAILNMNDNGVGSRQTASLSATAQ